MTATTARFETDVAHCIHVLLISGSLRGRSTNTSVVRTMEVLAPEEIVAAVYQGLADLPHFNPDDDVDPLHPAVAALRSQIRSADALLFSTPEYAGALPGSFKNLLDWTIGDDEIGSIYEKPVAWINASPRGAVAAHESLRHVLGYAKAVIVEAACTQVPMTTAMVGNDGLVSDPRLRDQIVRALMELAGHVADLDGHIHGVGVGGLGGVGRDL
jgi:chromate reductase